MQSNKAAEVARRFDWVHTVASPQQARRLAQARPAERAPLNVCLQVNADDAPGKAGVAPHDAAQLAALVASLPALRLRGLMTGLVALHGSDEMPFQTESGAGVELGAGFLQVVLAEGTLAQGRQLANASNRLGLGHGHQPHTAGFAPEALLGGTKPSLYCPPAGYRGR